MITNQQIKLIQSLKMKKKREELGLFVVEGKKLVDELIHSSFEIESIYHTNDCKFEHKKAILVHKKELDRISQFKTNNDALAIVKCKSKNVSRNPNGLSLVLDSINDPGNLGTIIRTADWFNISTIYCSENTVDSYNHKVIQASMGSIFRVDVIYTNLTELLKIFKGKVYGAMLNGNNIYKENLEKNALVVIGSESHGISEEIMPYITNPITIKSFGKAESLNAAVATSIICSEFKRNS